MVEAGFGGLRSLFRGENQAAAGKLKNPKKSTEFRVPLATDRQPRTPFIGGKEQPP
jgi:hypothetical protein